VFTRQRRHKVSSQRFAFPGLPCPLPKSGGGKAVAESL
jgi:hypothetical protein